MKRQEFREEIAKYKVEERVYIDEAGMDNREDYGYGWNEKGERFHALKSGKRSGRVNMIAGVCQENCVKVQIREVNDPQTQ